MVFCSNDKDLSLRVDVIGWNSLLKKKKKYIYIYIYRRMPKFMISTLIYLKKTIGLLLQQFFLFLISSITNYVINIWKSICQNPLLAHINPFVEDL